MKKVILPIVACLFSIMGFSQDKMEKHSGETLDVKIIKVAETVITFKYPGEDAEQTISKLAVANIVYGGSGRKEEISEKIEIKGKLDWEKVQILNDLSQTVGLKKGKDVLGKTSGVITMNTAGSADKKALKRIKEAAAEEGAAFVLLSTDKTDNFGVKQSIKKGVAYSYK